MILFYFLMEYKISKNKNNNYNSNLENSTDESNLQEIINKIKPIKAPENKNTIQDKLKLFSYLKIDRKMYSLLSRTYYMKEFEKIETYINSQELIKNFNLSNEQYIKLISFFNSLFNMQNMYINKEDYARSLQLQNKIINILKKYIINKIG